MSHVAIRVARLSFTTIKLKRFANHLKIPLGGYAKGQQQIFPIVAVYLIVP